ncbi:MULTISPECIES: ABC transporter ATP-binding protein [unclassified Curtobacterium]|uniref:ABC transporter ATP-binding protein n=1 Tax=unclassified Curtobacterium TaxID=257496 RepID=UPI0039AFA391
MTIDLCNVGVRGRGRPRLDDITIQFAPAMTYGLVGPNGAGKTSLMAAVAGLVRPSTGTISVAGGQSVVIGAVLAENGLHPGRTVRETLRLRAAYVGAPRSDVAAALQSSGLERVARRRVGALSLGMKMRLGIAVALLGDPVVVLLDEPMNGLDPNGIVWVRETVRRLRARGAVVVISSHLLSELESMIDVAVVMSSGRIACVQSMNLQASSGCIIEVSDTTRMIDALTASGETAERRGDRILAGCAVAEGVRLAVRHDIDVRSIVPASVDLEMLYAEASAGEHIAEVGR